MISSCPLDDRQFTSLFNYLIVPKPTENKMFAINFTQTGPHFRVTVPTCMHSR